LILACGSVDKAKQALDLLGVVVIGLRQFAFPSASWVNYLPCAVMGSAKIVGLKEELQPLLD